MYTAKNYQKVLETLKKNFPHYLYCCPFRGKEVLSVPLDKIKKVFLPEVCLQQIFDLENKDTIQKETAELVCLLSKKSKVPVSEFGIHGSVGLNMHSEYSDIDLVVYGSQNFKKLEGAINGLADKSVFSHVCTKKIDYARLHRGRYNDRRFVYNAEEKLRKLTPPTGS